MANPINPIASPAPSPFNLGITHELKLSKDAEEWLKSASSGWFQNYDQIQGLWNAPSTQFSLTLMKDAEFRSAVQQMKDSHLGNQFFGYEIVLIIILWTVRAWRLTKVSTWLTRIWTQAWIGLVYWFCATLVVPSLVWGEAFRTGVSHLLKAFFRHFFA